MKSSKTEPACLGISRGGRDVAAHEAVDGQSIVDADIRQGRITSANVAGDERKAAVEFVLVIAGDDGKRNTLALKTIVRKPLVRIRTVVPAEVFLPPGKQALRIEGNFGQVSANEYSIRRRGAPIYILKEREKAPGGLRWQLVVREARAEIRSPLHEAARDFLSVA